MATKLYVGNLPYKATSESLGEMFAQAGSVISSAVISDRFSGRSKGFGFVEMGSDKEAQDAIKMFHDKELEGRRIVVNEARPKPGEESSAPRAGTSESKDETDLQ